jgi:hypothetical protein
VRWSEERQLQIMPAEKSLYAVHEPDRIIYVDTDDQSVALKVAQLSGETHKMGYAAPPRRFAQETVNPQSLGRSQEHEGTKYWVVPPR